MISLDDNKDYYILVDLQGGTFGGGRIFESKTEVFEQFSEWAEADEMEDTTLKGYTFSDLMEVWEIDILKYDGKDFRNLLESEVKETKYGKRNNLSQL